MGIICRELNSYYRELWMNLKCDISIYIKENTYNDKKKNEKEFDLLIDKIIGFIESFPKDDLKRKVWRKKGNQYLNKMIINKEFFRLGQIDKDMKDGFIKSTKDFIKEAKKFDKDISYEDIGQAMRNVWIINILQKSFGEEVKFTNGMFGYSMLYPYTDNYLDDTKISAIKKREFNEKLTRRLKGENVASESEHEKKVYKLVEYIESQFSRDVNKGVYDKLLLIQQGQILSLAQQNDNNYDMDFLGISIEKGGASVLADGYLIRGDMDYDEEIFSYGYGFLLQLSDDLQDIKNDRANNHITLMVDLVEKQHLDFIVNKLINLTIKVVDDAKCFKCNNIKEVKELIKNNCLYMILFAVLDNREYFSEEYMSKIDKYLPFTMGYCVNLKENMKTKFTTLKKEYYGFTLEDILLYFIE